MTTCRGDEPAEARTIARVGVGYSWARTDLRFANGPSAAFSRHAVVVTGEAPLGARGVGQIGAGGIADGEIDTDEAHALRPGWLFFASYTHRIIDERGAWPFVLGSASVGASAARTFNGRDSSHFSALDVRAGVTVGKTFGPLSPFVAARVFGGPVFWTRRGQALTGSDKYHYQPAIGVVVARRPADLFVEWAFAGERSIGAGVGVAF